MDFWEGPVMKKNQALGKLIIIAIVMNLALNGIAKDDSQVGLEPEERLPGFTLPDLEDKDITLQEFLGKIVIIHLWKCQ
jgi:hypothetical protein